jgi:hypothetical protein
MDTSFSSSTSINTGVSKPLNFFIFLVLLFYQNPKSGEVMSQKSELIVEEKSQLNLLEESSKFIINTSVLGFVGAAFMSAMGKQNVILLIVLSSTLGVGIFFKVLSNIKNKETKNSI